MKSLQDKKLIIIYSNIILPNIKLVRWQLVNSSSMMGIIYVVGYIYAIL